MLTSIKSRSVIVTGGSKGIGKGIAQVFAAQGARVMIAARGETDGMAAVEELPPVRMQTFASVMCPTGIQCRTWWPPRLKSLVD